MAFDTAVAKELTLATAQAFAGVNYLSGVNIDSTMKSNSDLAKLLPADQNSSVQAKVDSIFNKFTVFSYSALSSTNYKIEGHFIGYGSGLNAGVDKDALVIAKKAGLNADPSDSENYAKINELVSRYTSGKMMRNLSSNVVGANSTGTQVLRLSNPTAKQLVNWGGDESAKTPVGFQPYALTDFFYCTYYGKVPNNRLITLRRYPFPVGDSVRLSTTNVKKNAIPIAQAVTWFGSETGNQLSKLGVFSWDMPWKTIGVDDPQVIEGNEITMDALLGALTKVKGGDTLATAIKTAYTATGGSEDALKQLSGADVKLQDYMRNLYTTGPYWNRIYGPVNVVNQTSHRDRGMQKTNWQTTFPIKFSYKFRSFNGISPKIAALDLISNFLTLTYNDAQFLGQLNRYFEKTGLKFSPTVTEALGQILTSWGTTFNGNNADAYAKVMEAFSTGLTQVAANVTNDPLAVAQKTIQSTIMNKELLGAAMPAFVSVKSALSDRPIGEWHIVVGNPMNPIFVMGDLVCTDVKMEWDDELGPDDFPTGCSFTVTLKQGKPRDKSAIERMLNGGNSGLTRSEIPTSSEADTFGTMNNKTWNEVTNDNKSADEALQKAFDGLTKSDKDQFVKFRSRVNNAYNMKDPGAGSLTDTKSSMDNSILMLYYQRRYNKN